MPSQLDEQVLGLLAQMVERPLRSLEPVLPPSPLLHVVGRVRTGDQLGQGDRRQRHLRKAGHAHSLEPRGELARRNWTTPGAWYEAKLLALVGELVDDLRVPGDEIVELVEPGAQFSVLVVQSGESFAEPEDLGVVAVDMSGAVLELAHEIDVPVGEPPPFQPGGLRQADDRQRSGDLAREKGLGGPGDPVAIGVGGAQGASCGRSWRSMRARRRSACPWSRACRGAGDSVSSRAVSC
jgi:hypothetical protein